MRGMLRVLHRAARHQQWIRGGNFRSRAEHLTLVRYDNQRRNFIDIPTVLLPPVIFGGLVITLWTWKCFMMVLFQNKIIYMPGLPPNARRETIAEYKSQCSGIEWREEKIKAADGTRISLCVASVDSNAISPSRSRVYILYFQGNASSLPPRLPFLSPVLRILRDRQSTSSTSYTMVCCCYRGYWTSKGRPSEKGIALDAVAALKWIEAQRGQSEQIKVVFWGQSIGAGVAANLASQQNFFSRELPLKALILETPFLSIRAMLETLYPQKWLPYRHLWPFLWNHLDTSKALAIMKEKAAKFELKTPNVLILEAGNDELVPSSHGEILYKRCIDLGLDVEKQVVGNALHTEVMVRPEGRLAVVKAIRKLALESSDDCKNPV